MSGLRSAVLHSLAGLVRQTIPFTVVAWVGLGLGTPLAGQEDFRAADLDRPILVEDAYPVKFREWEFEMGLRGGLAEGARGVELIAELKTGLFLNGQAGLELEAGAQDQGNGSEAGTVSGIETVRGHLLYNFNRETWSWPAFAVRVDLSTPGTGSLGRQDWGIGFKGIATRSLGRVRMHANGGYVAASADDAGDYWQLGLAFDYPIGLFSKAIVGDIYMELPVNAGRTRVWAEFGTRWQISNLSVLDFGIASRLDEWQAGNANVQLILGISRVFGLAALVSVPRYPNPRIN